VPVADKQAAKELDFLAHLVHVAKPSAGDNFKLNLFLDGFGDDDDGQAGGVQQQKPAAASKTSKQLEFGSGGRNDDYIKASRLGDVLAQVQLQEDDKVAGNIGDELLDLMDGLGA
jgi:hypothetical protein